MEAQRTGTRWFRVIDDEKEEEMVGIGARCRRWVVLSGYPSKSLTPIGNRYTYTFSFPNDTFDSTLP
ncbi:hypothetical protein L6452_03041 [Arctium lappa]|uniref:Uncharacterized protein n=1 Tax=Arctium lappa TaxID=4217 RepID=A0ACB9FL48_ARCLA|nr:hypothetical protein L6452_03041 [Arctium lappa]